MFVPLWIMLTGIYLVSTVLMLIIILINLVPKFKKFRPYVNPLWFLPGLVMLAGVILYGAMLASSMGQSIIQGIVTGARSHTAVRYDRHVLGSLVDEALCDRGPEAL